ncbi:hypothetical protein [Paratissierella segnis]|uniref:Uncharacterized protein n=1 Tax=Paratissierella segnis TaxID=2763679 RepID=A0A926EY81_9FIRM|nr:hypothetical protein [Paratissierella segnis]MBC8588415.1 hypothetical protein [Paratissierella segnis]
MAKTLMTTLDELTGTRRYSMFVVWFCSDKDKRETWEEFTSKNNYKNMDYKYAEENWLLDEGIQKGIKYYMKLQHSEKMKNIYDKMYQQALNGDVQSAKYLMDFSKDFFASDKTSELDNLLSGIDLGEEVDDDE